MADETGAMPVEPVATTGPAEGTGAAAATAATPDPLGEGGKAAIAQERARAKAAEARATAAETELQKHRDAQLSDIEKANKRAEAAEQARTTAETALRERTVQGAVMTAAAAANFVNPDLASRLIAVADVELDADGKELRRFAEKEKMPKEMHANFYAMFQLLPNGHLVFANWQAHGPGHG